jgi:hypothetical protein
VQKGKFIVIDGKQRLLTLAGFMDPSIKYWDKSKLQNLLVRTDLNEKTWDEISQDPRLSAEFENTSLRCKPSANPVLTVLDYL